jgi:beta-lactamase class A
MPPRESPTVTLTANDASPTPEVDVCGRPIDPLLPIGGRLSPPGDVPPIEAFDPIPFRQDLALAAELVELLGDENKDDYAFYVKDLRTGRGAVYNGDRIFYAASLYKLFVMHEAFHQASHDILDLESIVTLTPFYDSFGLGPRLTEVCQELTVMEALTAMMSWSDNAAAVLLQDLVGVANINRSLAGMGLSDSRLLADGLLPVTAQDLGLLLEAIGLGEAVNREASEQMLQLMVQEVFDNGIGAALPPEAVLAHKTGNWSNATHDAGIVFTESEAYVIVVLAERGYETQMTRAISAMVYAYFASDGASLTPTPTPRR